MYRLLIVFILSVVVPASGFADVLALKFGASSWNTTYDGDAQSGPDTLDLEDDMGIDDDNSQSFYVAFEHFIPILPNILLQRTTMEVSEKNALSRSIRFEDVTFSESATIESTLDFTHTDLTLYYEIFDNDLFSIDIGLTARAFEEGIKLESDALAGDDQSSEKTAEFDIDATLPMAYGHVRIELPIDVFIAAEANYVSYDGSSLMDTKLSLGYKFGFGLSIEAGMRSFELDYEDDDDETADVTIDGVFVGLRYHL